MNASPAVPGTSLSGPLGTDLRHSGYAVFDLLDAGAIALLAQTCRRHHWPSAAGFASTVLCDDAELRAAVHEAIRSIIEPRLAAVINGHRLVLCTFAVKRAGRADGEVPLHQDWSFVDETRFASLGLWCPLIDVEPANGCLQVVPGSHALPHPPRAACAPFLYPELIERLRAGCLTDVPLRAGQAMLFDNRLFHCSPPNRSSDDRIAATAVLVPAEAPLRYYHLPDRQEPHRVEVFEVDDAFYLTHRAPGRPQAGRSLGCLDLRQAPAES